MSAWKTVRKLASLSRGRPTIARRPVSHRLLLEALEDRTLPSVLAKVSGTTLAVSLSAGDTATHSVRLQQDTAHPTTKTDVLADGKAVGTFTNSTFTQITVTLGPGNATLDLGNVAVPSKGIVIDEGAGNNTLIGPAAGATWTITGANAGTIGSLIKFQDVQNLVGAGAVNTLTGSNGPQAAFNLVQGTNIRDHNNYRFNNIIAAGTPSVSYGNGQVRLDRQTFTLPSSFANATLTDIRLNGYGDNPTGQPFLAAADVVAQGSTTPAGVNLDPEVNANLQTYTHGNLYPAGDTSVTVGGVAFTLADYPGGGTGVLQTGAASQSSPSFIDVPVSIAGAQTFYSLINSAYGQKNYLDGSVQFFGTDAHNTWTLTGANAGIVDGMTFTRFTSLVGGTGNNTLIGSNADTKWTITGANAGAVDGMTFANFVNLVGGTGADAFAFRAGGSVSGTIVGGGGTDKLDYSAYASAVTVDLRKQSATASDWFSGTATATGGFSEIEDLVGSSAVNTLTGPNLTTVWALTGINQGGLTATGNTLTYPLTFQGFANLVGGSGQNTFQMIGNAFVTGSINGGSGGHNTLDYSAAAVAPANNIDYTNFAGTAGLTLNGPSTVTTSDGTVLRMVDTHGDESHSAFSGQPVSTASFSTTFQFRMTNPGGIKDVLGHVGADGLVFVLQYGSALTATGNAGDGLGYAGAFPHALGIAFDTFDNSPPKWPGFNDSSSNELGIDLNGSVIHNASNGAHVDVTPAFDNGKLWQAWVSYDGTTLNIYASDTGTKPSTPALSQKLNLPQIIGSPFAYAGFTSATGAGWQNTDVLNWQVSTPGILVDFDNGSKSVFHGTGIDGVFTNIQNVIGSAGTNTLRDNGSTKTTWTLTGSNAGSVDGLAFTNFTNLAGGTGADSFAFQPGASVSGGIDGGGSGWLDYSAFNAAVTVNLATGAATGVAGGANNGVSNVQNVIGSSAGNTLTGNARGNILIGGSGVDTITGGSGRSILIGGAGNDTITGGQDQDIIIAGTVNFGTSSLEAALATLLTEWQRTDETFAKRISNIRAGLGPNKAYNLVWTKTVVDGGGSDTLRGNPAGHEGAADWFFANLAAGHDTIVDKTNSDIVN